MPIRSVTQQRDVIVALAPPWLQGDIGSRYLVNLGLGSDAVLEKGTQAVLARMPGRGDPTQLPLIGADRVMTQGPGETNDAFALRLQRAFDTWQHAGEARAVLELVASYTAGQQTPGVGNVPIVAIVGGYQAKKWDWFMAGDDPGAPPKHSDQHAGWSWDGLESTRWWRSWLILFAQLSSATHFGGAASIVSRSGQFATVTGLAGIPSDVTSPTLPAYITLGGTGDPKNAGTFQVTQYLSATSVVVAMPGGSAPDASNGAIDWSIAYYPGFQPAPVLGFPGAPALGSNTNIAVGVQLPGPPNSVNTAGYFAQLRALVRLWKSAQTFYPWFILSFGGQDQSPGSEFSPWSSQGSGNPDGTWAHWSKVVNGVRVATRVTGVQAGMFDCFIDGTGFYVNCNEPNT